MAIFRENLQAHCLASLLCLMLCTGFPPTVSFANLQSYEWPKSGFVTIAFLAWQQSLVGELWCDVCQSDKLRTKKRPWEPTFEDSPCPLPIQRFFWSWVNRPKIGFCSSISLLVIAFLFLQEYLWHMNPARMVFCWRKAVFFLSLLHILFLRLTAFGCFVPFCWWWSRCLPPLLLTMCGWRTSEIRHQNVTKGSILIRCMQIKNDTWYTRYMP